MISRETLIYWPPNADLPYCTLFVTVDGERFAFDFQSEKALKEWESQKILLRASAAPPAELVRPAGLAPNTEAELLLPCGEKEKK